MVLALAATACTAPLGTPGLSPAQVFEAVRPGVVIVETDDQVTWSVPQAVLTPEREAQLRARVVAMVRAGQVANTTAAIGQASLELLVQDPGAWFTTGSGRHRQTDSVLALGTGFFVTEDGYLLTNDHVVESSSDGVRQQLLGVLQRAGGDPAELANFRSELQQSLGVAVGEADAGRLFQWMLGVYRGDLRVESVRPTYRIGFGSMSVGDVRTKGLAVQLVAHGQATPGRDVAILRAPGGPYVSLALAPGPPPAGASLDVVGYPCRCQGDTAFDPAHLLSPVLTEGTARAEVPMEGGWSALGTDAHIEQGNSGGPVLDGQGRVVGLATFADTGAAAGPGVPRSFAVPSEVAVQLTDQAHVRPAQGPLGQAYQQAVADFNQDRYRAALPLFQRVAAAAPQDPTAGQYADRSRAAIAAGQDRTTTWLPWDLPGPALALAGGLVVLGAAAGLAVYLRRRRQSDVW
jgi:S1-C subfamily serine protease